MDLLNLVQAIGKKDAQLHSLKEKLDTSTSSGKLILNVIGVLAEYERESIRERTLDGLEAARKRGRVGGRPPVLGRQQRDMVLKMRREGSSLREIARMFNVSVGTVTRVLLKAHVADGQSTRRKSNTEDIE